MPLDTMIEDVSMHYRQEGLKNVYSILGSLNIIGNPSQIMRDFSGGFKSLSDPRSQRSNQVLGGAGVIAKGTIGGYFQLTLVCSEESTTAWEVLQESSLYLPEIKSS